MAPIPDFGPGRRLLWRTLWYPTRVAASALYRLNVEREAPIPGGALVVAPNHYEHPDPVFAALAVRRPVRFLALDELWGQTPVLDGAFKTFGAIPLPRGRYPLSAMRAALNHLESGGAVGVFPEGRRVERWGEERPRRGAAWLAMRTGAPVVPVALWGTQDTMDRETLAPKLAPVRVRIGEPIQPDDYLGHDDPIGALTATWEAWVGASLTELAAQAEEGAQTTG